MPSEESASRKPSRPLALVQRVRTFAPRQHSDAKVEIERSGAAAEEAPAPLSLETVTMEEHEAALKAKDDEMAAKDDEMAAKDKELEEMRAQLEAALSSSTKGV